MPVPQAPEQNESGEEEKEEGASEEEKSIVEDIPEVEPEWEYEFRTIGKSRYGLLG